MVKLEKSSVYQILIFSTVCCIYCQLFGFAFGKLLINNFVIKILTKLCFFLFVIYFDLVGSLKENIEKYPLQISLLATTVVYYKSANGEFGGICDKIA